MMQLRYSLMQMRYFWGQKRTSWLCSGPCACSKKPPYYRDTRGVLLHPRCVTAWWMIADGGAGDKQPGQLWHEGIMEYTCSSFVHQSLFLSYSSPSLPAAGSSNMWSADGGGLWGFPSWQVAANSAWVFVCVCACALFFSFRRRRFDILNPT